MKKSNIERMTEEAQELAHQLVPLLHGLHQELQQTDIKTLQSQLRAVNTAIHPLKAAGIAVPEELTRKQESLEYSIQAVDPARRFLAGFFEQIRPLTPPAHTAYQRRTPPRPTANSRVSLAELFDADILQDGTEVVHLAKRSGRRITGTLLRPGIIELCLDGHIQRFDTPSGAGKAASGRSTDGWMYWHIERNNEQVPLDYYRSRYLKWRKELGRET